MRLTSVLLYASETAEPMEFSIFQPDIAHSRYRVKQILGLDADEITPRFYGSGNAPLTRYYESNLKQREIAIQLMLDPNYEIDESVSDLRDALYRSISSSRYGGVMLQFKSGATTVAQIPGFITRVEAQHFSKQPGVTVTVSCPDPIFRGVNPSRPFAGDVTLYSSKVSIPDSLSTAPHGFSFQATFAFASASFTIQSHPTDPEWSFKVTPAGGFLIGDVLYFSSDWTDKYLFIIRGGVTYHLLNRLEPGSVWPTLFPGSNNLYFVDFANVHLNLLEFLPAYWGV